MAPKQKRGRDTVERLLAGALAVYAAEGADRFTVYGVLDASGVSLGSLYHHFGSFDGLAAALYSRCMAHLLDALAAALDGADTARDGITALVRAYLAFTAEHRAEAHVIHASSYASYLPAHTAEIAAAEAPRIEALLTWLRPHVRAGRVVDLPEPLIEMLLIGPVAETARRALAGVPGIDLTEAARVLPERVWRSLAAD